MKAIKSTENKAIHTHIDLLTIVETLKKNKVSLQEITITLGMFHKDGITPNQSILNKLCTGALKTYKNKGSDFYINSLLQNEQYKNILFSIIPECKREDSSFVFYYYDKDQINLLVLYLYKNNKSKGDIFFLNHSNGQFFESSRLEVDSIYTKNPETYDIFCKEKKLSNINYFNCYKGRQSIEDTKICYATYYSTNAYNSNPKFIIGVLERVPACSMNDYLKNTDIKNIKFDILHLLQRKLQEHTSIDIILNYSKLKEDLHLIPNSPLSSLVGLWDVFYLEPAAESKNQTNNIQFCLLNILPNGFVELFYLPVLDSERTILSTLKGVIKLPVENQINVITLDLEDSHKESKFNLHLRFENNSFSGINTAWRKFDSRISTSPVIIHKSSTPMHTEALTHQLVQSYFEEIENQLFKSKSLKKKILDELEITSSRFLTNP